MLDCWDLFHLAAFKEKQLRHYRDHYCDSSFLLDCQPNAFLQVHRHAFKWFSCPCASVLVRIKLSSSHTDGLQLSVLTFLCVSVSETERERAGESFQPHFTAHANRHANLSFQTRPSSAQPVRFLRTLPVNGEILRTTCWSRKMTGEEVIACRWQGLRGLTLRCNIRFIISMQRTCRFQQMLVRTDLFYVELGQTHTYTHTTGYTWSQVPCGLFWAQQCNVLNTAYTSDGWIQHETHKQTHWLDNMNADTHTSHNVG